MKETLPCKNEVVQELVKICVSNHYNLLPFSDAQHNTSIQPKTKDNPSSLDRAGNICDSLCSSIIISMHICNSFSESDLIPVTQSTLSDYLVMTPLDNGEEPYYI